MPRGGGAEAPGRGDRGRRTTQHASAAPWRLGSIVARGPLSVGGGRVRRPLSPLPGASVPPAPDIPREFRDGTLDDLASAAASKRAGGSGRYAIDSGDTARPVRAAS